MTLRRVDPPTGRQAGRQVVVVVVVAAAVVVDI